MKELSEMTSEELWELFPISLVPHNDRWNNQYAEMETFLSDKLSSYDITRISHIGSTAINGILAKNIVDILLEIACSEDIEKVADTMQNNGFLLMSKEKGRISLNYGYTPMGFAEKVYHLHIRYAGDNDELYFRDYMNDHPGIATAYEALKLYLCKKYKNNRDAYTAEKTDFIEKRMIAARRDYKDRY